MSLVVGVQTGLTLGVQLGLNPYGPDWDGIATAAGLQSAMGRSSNAPVSIYRYDVSALPVTDLVGSDDFDKQAVAGTSFQATDDVLGTVAATNGGGTAVMSIDDDTKHDPTTGGFTWLAIYRLRDLSTNVMMFNKKQFSGSSFPGFGSKWTSSVGLRLYACDGSMNEVSTAAIAAADNDIIIEAMGYDGSTNFFYRTTTVDRTVARGGVGSLTSINELQIGRCADVAYVAVFNAGDVTQTHLQNLDSYLGGIATI